MKSMLLRTVSVLAAGLVAAGLTASGATASPSALQRFSVPSGDNCTYGRTEGNIEWRSAVPTSTVRLTGLVEDRPVQNDPGSVCRDDSRYTIATYAAYAGDRRVDEAARRVDNGVVRLDVVLGTNTLPVAIDRVVIQVCRASILSPGAAPDYCGRLYTYTPSPIIPAVPR